MATTTNTQAHQPLTGLITTIGVVYGLVVFLTAFLISRNITTFRDKALRKLPTRFQENTFIQDTLQALIIVVPSLLWPLFMMTILFTIAGNRSAAESQQDPDLERGASSSDSDSEFDELRRRETIDTLGGREAAPPYIHSPPYAARAPSAPRPAHTRSPARQDTNMPPPPYAPYPSVLDTLQTQWVQMSDRCAESYIRLLNDVETRTPAELTQLGRSLTIIPRRR